MKYLPGYVRIISLRDLFDERITGATAIKKIKTAWKTNKSIFKVDARQNTLSYDAGIWHEADKIVKELPEDIEAFKSGNWIVMRLDFASRFFGIEFKKGLLGWLRS